MPLIQISNKDRVAEEVLPFLVEGLTLTVVSELRCEDGFDILRVCGEEYAASDGRGFDRVARRGIFGGT